MLRAVRMLLKQLLLMSLVLRTMMLKRLPTNPKHPNASMDSQLYNSDQFYVKIFKFEYTIFIL